MKHLAALLLGPAVALAALLPPRAGAAGLATAPVLRGYLAELGGDSDAALAGYREALAADPDSVELRVLASRLLAASRRYAEALALVEEGLAREARPTLLVQQARILDALGRREEAAKAALEAATKEGDAGAYELAVRLLERAGSVQLAEETAVLWAAKFPEDADAQYALGQALVRRGDRSGSRRALERALRVEPAHLPSLGLLATLLEEAGEHEAAEELYRRLVESNPHDVNAALRLGQLLLKAGKAEDAQAVLRRIERWAGGDTGVALRFGMLLVQGGRYAEAEAVLAAAAGAHPEEPGVWYLLGVSRQAQQKFEEALEAFGRVPEAAAEYGDCLVRRGAVLAELDRHPEAKALLAGWLASHADDEEVTLALAEVVEDEGDRAAAAALLEELVARRPETRNAQIFFALGALYDGLKESTRSADYMRRSLELNPENPFALNYLGYTYAEQGVNLEEAEKLILKALELSPDQGFIVDSLGWVYYRQGRFAEAARELKRAVELAPKDAVIWEHLGDALRATGDEPAAREAYTRSGELDPASSSAKQKLEQGR